MKNDRQPSLSNAHDNAHKNGAGDSGARNNDAQRARILQEQEVVEYMITLFCKAKHQKGPPRGHQEGHTAAAGKPVQAGLCEHCEELRVYAQQRNERCPFVETRSFCQFCKVHCYRQEMRQRIGEVMRYAGPRMIWYKPVYALRHLKALRAYRRGT